MALLDETITAGKAGHRAAHEQLHKKANGSSIDVQADFGATGDGTTDDTAAIQAAFDAAGAYGNARVALPPGDYFVTDTLDVNGSGALRLSGSIGRNAEGTFGAGTGTRIYGTNAGALIQRTNTDETPLIIEDLAIWNTHATGKGIDLVGVAAPGGVYRSSIRAHKGLTWGTNTFNAVANNCDFGNAGTMVDSYGISTSNHIHCYNNDIAGYNYGILAAGAGVIIAGARIETCINGINAGSVGFSGLISGISFEANDTSLYLSGVSGAQVSGCRILGSSNAPSGSSDYGININECFGLLISGVVENGTHANNFVNIQSTATRFDLSLISVFGSTAWGMPADKHDITIINCSPENDIIRAPVIATGSLPAAATGENGRMVIEDNGAGDRNLILYAGGQRFRIDGGAAI